jgi:hypothetical protein
LLLGTIREDRDGKCGLPPLELVRISDGFDNPALVVERAIRARHPRVDDWLERTDDGWRLAADVDALAAQIAGRATELLPRLAAGAGEGVEIVVNPAGEERVVVRLTRSGVATAIEWGDLGAGTRRWVAASVEAAALETLPATTGGEWSTRLLVVDEPELHLHAPTSTPAAPTSAPSVAPPKTPNGARAAVERHPLGAFCSYWTDRSMWYLFPGHSLGRQYRASQAPAARRVPVRHRVEGHRHMQCRASNRTHRAPISAGARCSSANEVTLCLRCNHD